MTNISPNPLLRRIVLALGVVNLLCAIAVFLLLAGHVAMTSFTITSTYRELDSNSVINHGALETLWGKEYVEDWGKVVRKLGGESLSSLRASCAFVSVLFAANGILLLLSSCLGRKEGRSATPDVHVQQRELESNQSDAHL